MLALAACARQGMPPGGETDGRPPVVVRTVPEPSSPVTDLSAPIRFEFNERISESAARGLDAAVVVSPRGGRVRVHHERTALRVEVEGGLRSGVAYRVTLLPVVSDLFGNAMRDPFELVFTTGGALPEATLAGDVWDRITGRGVGEAALWAVGADSLTYLSVASSDGIFAFRHLPEGAYTVTAFEDLSANGDLDRAEPRGSMTVQVGGTDTLLVSIPVLAPDTTPALLTRVQVLDSITLVAEFDDPLEPTSSPPYLTLTREEGSPQEPAVVRVLHEHEYRSYVAEVRDSLARADSAGSGGPAPTPASIPAPTPTPALGPGVDAGAPNAPDVGARPSATGDSVGATPGSEPPKVDAATRGPTPLEGAGVSAGGAGGMGPGGLPLPSRRVVALLSDPLPAGAPYRAQAGGATNVNGLTGGGGELRFERSLPAPEPERPDAALEPGGGNPGPDPSVPPTGVNGPGVPPPAVPDSGGGAR